MAINIPQKFTKKNLQGSALIFSLACLALFSLMAISGAKQSLTEGKINANALYHIQSSHGLESALILALQNIKSIPLHDVSTNINTCLLYVCLRNQSQLPDDLDDQPESWWKANAQTFSTNELSPNLSYYSIAGYLGEQNGLHGFRVAIQSQVGGQMGDQNFIQSILVRGEL